MMAGGGSKVRTAFSRVLRLMTVVAVVAVMVPVGVPAASAGPSEADTYYVDAVNGDNANPGTEAAPFKTITYAASVSDSFDTIWVEPGTYDATLGESFPITFGGQSLKSTQGADTTIIQTSGARLLVFLAWGNGDSLEGFTIKNGGGATSSAVYVDLMEATALPTAPVVAGCTFTDSFSVGLGGALYVLANTNTNLVITENTFTSNTAEDGGAISAFVYGSVEISDNVFASNYATSQGGALYLFTGSGGDVTVSQNLLQNNQSDAQGGAIYWEGSTPNTHKLHFNTLTGNSAVYGGALYLRAVTLNVEGNEGSSNYCTSGLGNSGFAYLDSSTVTAESNYLSNNNALTGAAVWHVGPGSALTEVNDTLLTNWGPSYTTLADASATLNVTNCIYWNSTIAELAHADTVSFTCANDSLSELTGNGSTVGSGMVYTSPNVDGLNPPVLLNSSPCIDAGSPTIMASFDFFGTPLPQDGRDDGTSQADIGCYEKPTPPHPPAVILTPVYRFYNFTNNTHFYTDSASERDMVIARWPNVYNYEGPAYYLNPANNTTRLTRLYNRSSGSHFYTASAGEAAEALAKWPNVFLLDGLTYAVNPGPVANSIPVFRFYNMRNGSHFFTASESERNDVIAKYPKIYSYEGPAFWLGQ